jgi:hypothetical protein
MLIVILFPIEIDRSCKCASEPGVADPCDKRSENHVRIVANLKDRIANLAGSSCKETRRRGSPVEPNSIELIRHRIQGKSIARLPRDCKPQNQQQLLTNFSLSPILRIKSVHEPHIVRRLRWTCRAIMGRLGIGKPCEDSA